jgi:hypothetical protein
LSQKEHLTSTFGLPIAVFLLTDVSLLLYGFKSSAILKVFSSGFIVLSFPALNPRLVLLRELLADLDSPSQLTDFMDTVLTWVDERERVATVYFVTSIGATSTCEAVRKDTRDDLTKKATKAFTVMSPNKDKVEIAVAGFALIALLESVSRARLELDPSYRTLGPMRFRANAAALAEHLVR